MSSCLHVREECVFLDLNKIKNYSVENDIFIYDYLFIKELNNMFNLLSLAIFRFYNVKYDFILSIFIFD